MLSVAASVLLSGASAATWILVNEEVVVTGTSNGFENEAVDDASANTKTEGTTGTSRSVTLTPNAQGDTSAWVAFGCAEAVEWQCVDEGVSTHDGNTTFVREAGTDSEYNLTTATIDTQETVTNVRVRQVVRENASSLDLHEIFIETTDGVNNCNPTPVNVGVTVAFATYTADYADCAGLPWNQTFINNLQVGVGALAGTTTMVVTAVEVVLTIAATYSIDITSYFRPQETEQGVSAVLFLDCSGAESGDGLNVQWNGQQIASSRCLAGNELTAWRVVTTAEDAVRFVDEATADTTQTTYSVDLLALVTTDAAVSSGLPPPKALPLLPSPVNTTASCTYAWWPQTFTCRDTSANWSGPSLWLYEGADFYNGSEVTFPSGEPWWSVDASPHRLRLVHPTKAATYYADLTVTADDTPRFWIAVLAAIAVLGIAIALRVRARQRAEERHRRAPPSAPPESSAWSSYRVIP